MTRIDENERFAHFRRTGEPEALAAVFDLTAPELLRVAAHLGNGDRELVHDALQATFLTAIEDAEQWDEGRAVRPWLLGILANHVRKHRRQTRKQRGPDAATLHSVVAGGESPAGAAEQREFSSAATAAMQELPPPFREVIVLHLQHGLSAREIGDALGRPAGTVRTQVVRGLERLRSKLPAGFVGLTAVSVTLLAPDRVLAAVRGNVLGSLPATAAGSSSLFFTSWRLETMIATAIAATLAVLIPLFVGDDPTPLPHQASTTATTPRAELGRASPDRQLVAVNDSPTEAMPSPPQNERPAFDPQRPTVVFEVVYEEGDEPAAGVPIGILLDKTLQRWETDTDGKLEVALPWPGYHEVFVLGTGARDTIRWPDFVRPPTEPETCRLVIERGMTLEVRVVDADGKPVAGALVESSHGSQPHQMLSPFGRTDAEGKIVRRHIGTNGQLRAWADGHLPSRIINADGAVGDRRVQTLKLPGAGFAAHGTAHDEDGNPLQGAHLAFVQLTSIPRQPQFVITDAEGKFAIGALGRGNHALSGIHTKDGVTRRGHLRFSHGGDGGIVLDFKMTRGARVEGQLTNVQGQPLSGTNVVARDRPEGIHGLPFLETWSRSGKDGRFVIDGLVAGRYQLECEHCENRIIDLAPGEVATWNPQRASLSPVEFELVDSKGQPLAGWQIGVIPPGSEYPRGGSLTGEDGRLPSDSSGFRYPTGSFVRLAVSPPLGKHENKWQDFSRWPSLVTPPLAVGMEHRIRVPDHVRAMHRIQGAIVDAAGKPVPDSDVRLQGAFGSAWGNEFRTDPETGAFAAEDLPPGRYHAYAVAPNRPWLTLPPIDARGGGTIALGDIVLQELGRAIVTIVADADTSPPKRVELIGPGKSTSTWALRRQKDGTWRSRTLYRGEYTLRAWSNDAWAAPQKVRLEGDETRATATLTKHAPTRLSIDLPADFPRHLSSWSGKLIAKDAAGRTVQHKLTQPFYGTFTHHLEFTVPLPVGTHSLSVSGYYDSRGTTTCTVPAGGGGTARIVIE